MSSARRFRSVPEDKVVSYLLNPDHPIGGPKAHFFRSFGFSLKEWWRLAAALRDHPDRNPIAATIETLFGTKYVIRCKIATADGRDPCIVTVWMRERDAPARLMTAYPDEAP